MVTLIEVLPEATGVPFILYTIFPAPVLKLPAGSVKVSPFCEKPCAA
jgi:hypothetical protein